MFGLFKRSKIENWEIDLLKQTIIKLPEKYSYLINQIDDGLFRNVLLDASDIPGYVSFGFNFSVYKKYAKENERSFILSNVKVYDNYLKSYLIYNIYISSGVINGYSLNGGKKYNIDLNKIDVSAFDQKYNQEIDFDRIKQLLNEDEKMLINPSDIYSIKLNHKEFFHIKDLEDGDFIGLDSNNNAYQITHDPFEISPIKRENLIEVLAPKGM